MGGFMVIDETCLRYLASPEIGSVIPPINRINLFITDNNVPSVPVNIKQDCCSIDICKYPIK